jgi:Domain of Unknown Function (DUF928)
MLKIKFSPFLSVLAALLVAIVVAIGWQLSVWSIEFTPPNRGAPENLIGAGTRFSGEPGITRSGSSSNPQAIPVLVNGQALPCPFTVLVPKWGSDNYSLTIDPYPTFFVHVPAVENSVLSFQLSRGIADSADLTTTPEDRLVYAIHLPTNGQDGTFGIALPKYARPLEVGETYIWTVTLDLPPDLESDRPYMLEGQIERFEPESTLTEELARATPEQKVELYAQSSLWYDALEEIADLRLAYPNNPRLVTEWVELLTSVGLDEIAQKPLL